MARSGGLPKAFGRFSPNRLETREQQMAATVLTSLATTSCGVVQRWTPHRPSLLPPTTGQCSSLTTSSTAAAADPSLSSAGGDVRVRLPAQFFLIPQAALPTDRRLTSAFPPPQRIPLPPPAVAMP
ncbi:Os05g0453100 [Oryza sativa Japonica Group]|uniref:Os05g0453100 protein n=2 Tax=Oryza sativa subsp. japonica TaxID=39947 RepID=Q0DHP6_ORYSJ|nr:hypothetical protein EE612_029901 [Oryza sativa]KAF2931071.1 hypothetical protein DAI22_05g183000 [Oryza sativa Japonica Group]BAF17627.1 Os05g0453100 [Oryza sativa Japonica Group]BAS94339.1 Os05g0453100 [Oryza sativa Japonica Group]|eukprot:NP_001055713.1 Os05g0453100 [Oryza sativa Japonica Group]